MPLSFAGVAAEPASHAAIRSTGGLSAQSRTAMPPRVVSSLLLPTHLVSSHLISAHFLSAHFLLPHFQSTFFLSAHLSSAHPLGASDGSEEGSSDESAPGGESRRAHPGVTAGRGGRQEEGWGHDKDEIYEDPESTEVDESEDTDDTGASVEAAVKQEEEIVTMEAAAVNDGDGDGVNTFAAAVVVKDEAVNAKCVGVEAVKGGIMRFKVQELQGSVKPT
ncbi:unnamed protein product [Closterium sp. Naga37s-1]|nr:unnamed protein product [Closterium sp. Naga37s-1]